MNFLKNIVYPFAFLSLFVFFQSKCVTDAKACDGNPELDPGNNCLPYSDNSQNTPSDCVLGGSGSPDDPLQIRDYADLLCIGPEMNQLPLNAAYVLISDIDAGYSCGEEGCDAPSGAGGPVIGSSRDPFMGIFSGQVEGSEEVRTISNLYINRPEGAGIGLFGSVYDGHIKNLKLQAVRVIGQSNVGAVAGSVAGSVEGSPNRGSLKNLSLNDVNVSAVPSSTGSGNGQDAGGSGAGAVLGQANNVTITDVRVEGVAVSGKNNVGGAAGRLGEGAVFESGEVRVANVQADNANAGGLAGLTEGSSQIGAALEGGSVRVSVEGGTVSARSNAGGLVGKTEGESEVRGSHANVSVSGESNIGGLIGEHSSGSSSNTSLSKVSDSSAGGAVQGSVANVGGLIGRHVGGKVARSYAVGAVSGPASDKYAPSAVGGLIGYAGAPVTNSYASGLAGSVHIYGNAKVGGLIGHLEDTDISVTYADGYRLRGRSQLGGLVGLASVGLVRGVVIIRNSYAALESIDFADEGRSGGQVGGFVGHLEEGGSISQSFVASGLDASMQGDYVGMLIGKCALSNAKKELKSIYFLKNTYPFGRARDSVGSTVAGDCYLDPDPATGNRLPDKVLEIYKNVLLNRMQENLDFSSGGLGWTSGNGGDWSRLGVAEVYPCIRGLALGEETCSGGGGILSTLSQVSDLRLVNGDPANEDGDYQLSWAALGAPGIVYRVEFCDSGECQSEGEWSELAELSGVNTHEVTGQEYGDYVYRVRACSRLKGELSCYTGEALGGGSLQPSNLLAVSVRVLSPPGDLRLAAKTKDDEYDRSYDLEWNGVSSAVRYEWRERAEGAEGTGREDGWSEARSVQGNLRVSFEGRSQRLGPASYYYQVRACPASGFCSPWSPAEPLHVRVSLPDVAELPEAEGDSECQPAGVSVGRLMLVLAGDADCYGGRHSFRWRALSGYSGNEVEYEVRERKDGGDWILYTGMRFAPISHFEVRDGVVDVGYPVKSFSKRAGIYSYKVRGCTSLGCAAWPANERSFQRVEVPPMPLVRGLKSNEERNISYDGSYTLSWSSVTHATHYLLTEEEAAIRDGEAGEWRPLGEATLAEGLSHPFPGKSVSRAYRYRIQACSNNNCGDASSALIVQVRFLAQPEGLQSSPGSSYKHDYILSWDPVPDADSYTIEELKSNEHVSQSDRSASFWASAVKRSATVPRYDPPSPADGAITGFYHYRVRACKDVDGREEPVCSPWAELSEPVELCAVGQPCPSSSGSSSADFAWDVGGGVLHGDVYHVYKGQLNRGWYALSWTSLSGADVYYLQQKKGNGSWEYAKAAPGSGEKKALSEPLESFDEHDAGEYSYRVEGCAGSNCSGWQSVTVRVRVHDLGLASGERGLRLNDAQSNDPNAYEWNERGEYIRFVNDYSLLWNAVSYPGVSTYYKVERLSSGSEDGWEELGLIYPDSASEGELFNHNAAQNEAGSYAYRVRVCVNLRNLLHITILDRCSSEGDAGIRVTAQGENDLSVPRLEADSADLISYELSENRYIFYTGRNKNTNEEFSEGHYRISWEAVPGARSYRVYEQKDNDAERSEPVRESALAYTAREPGAYSYRVTACLDVLGLRCSRLERAETLALEVRSLGVPVLASVGQGEGAYRVSLNSQAFSDAGQRFYYELEEKEGEAGHWLAYRAEWDGRALTLTDNELGVSYAYRVKLCLKAPQDASGQPESHFCSASWSETASVRLDIDVPQLLKSVPVLGWHRNPIELSWIGGITNGSVAGYCLEEMRCGGTSCDQDENWVLTGAQSGNGPSGACDAMWVDGASSDSYQAAKRLGYAEYKYRIKKCTHSGGCSDWSQYGNAVLLSLPVPGSLSISSAGDVDEFEESGQYYSYDGYYRLNWDTSSLTKYFSFSDGQSTGLFYELQENDAPLLPDMAAGSSSRSISGKGHDENYSYKVRACTAAGCSPYSYPVKVAVGANCAFPFPIEDSGFNDGDGTPADPYLICTYAQLNIMRNNLEAHYELGADIDASAQSWNPIGNGLVSFVGGFNGAGYNISNLRIVSVLIDHSPEEAGPSEELEAGAVTAGDVGLFGKIETGAIIRNVALLDIDIDASSVSAVGGLVGWNAGGRVTNSFTAGSVRATGIGSGSVGGLIGFNSGTVTNSYAAVYVSGSGEYSGIGGLVGSNTGTVSNSYTVRDVSWSGSRNSIGGLVGRNYKDYSGGTVSNSFTAGDVSGSGSNNKIGGLVGDNATAFLYSGTVSGTNYFADDSGGDNGLSSGSCAVGSVCEQKTDAELRALTSVSGWTTGSSGNWDFGTDDSPARLPRLQYANTPSGSCDGNTGVTCGDLLPGQDFWRVGEWGRCSAVCGGGIRNRYVSCPYASCDGAEPTTSEICNTQICCNEEADCGSAINSCDAGTFRDRSDSSSSARWYCDDIGIRCNYPSSRSCSKAICVEEAACGSSVNSCDGGTFRDRSDSTTRARWYCDDIGNGCSSPSSRSCSRVRYNPC